VREAACHTLTKVAEAEVDGRVLPCLMAAIQDTVVRVRLSAMQALLSLAPRGDARAISALVARSADTDACVREAAMQHIPCLVTPGHAQAVAAVRRCLNDVDAAVRATAKIAEIQLCKTGEAVDQVD